MTSDSFTGLPLEATFLGVQGGQPYANVPALGKQRLPLLGATGLVAAEGATILVVFSDAGRLWLVQGPGVDVATQGELDAHAAGTAHFLAGDLKATARPAAPTGWLMCDGSLVLQADHPALYAAIGTTYNTGGETGLQFRLPNLKGRVAVGRDAAQAEFDTLGESGGTKTHTLSIAEMPSHNHGFQALRESGVHFAWAQAAGAADLMMASVPNQGGGGAHNNLPPYQVVNWMIYAGV